MAWKRICEGRCWAWMILTKQRHVSGWHTFFHSTGSSYYAQAGSVTGGGCLKEDGSNSGPLGHHLTGSIQDSWFSSLYFQFYRISGWHFHRYTQDNEAKWWEMSVVLITVKRLPISLLFVHIHTCSHIHPTTTTHHITGKRNWAKFCMNSSQRNTENGMIKEQRAPLLSCYFSG